MVGQTLLSNVLITRVVAAVGDGQAATTGDILDMSGYEGVMFIAKFADVTNAAVLTLAAQGGALVGGGDMATLAGTVTHTAASAGGDDDDLLVLDVYKPLERYIRPVLTSATQNAVKDGVIAIQYGAHSVPTTQGATVLDSDTLTSPAEA